VLEGFHADADVESGRPVDVRWRCRFHNRDFGACGPIRLYPVEDVGVGLVADLPIDRDAAALEVRDGLCVVAAYCDYVGAADVQAAQLIDEPPEAALMQKSARAIAVEEAIVVGVWY
jgi:hypothetical protein